MPTSIRFEVVVPPQLNPKAYRKILLKELGRQADLVLKLYLNTTRTWRHQPSWSVRLKETKKSAEVLVSTRDKIYQYVDKGTRPHRIRAKRAKRLAFQTKSTPKTRPRVLGSGQGGSSGSVVRPYEVRHPGTKAREFTQEIERRRRQFYLSGMAKAHEKALRAARRG